MHHLRRDADVSCSAIARVLSEPTIHGQRRGRRRIGRLMCCVGLICVAVGCEQLKDFDVAPETEVVMGNPVDEQASPAAPPPAPAPAQPKPVPATPEQVVEQFLALPPHARGDEELARLAEFEKAARQLESLDLTGSPVTDAGLTHLAAMPQLTSLTLDQTRLSSAGLQPLSALTSLRDLSLDRMLIDDSAFTWVDSASSLETLTVRGTPITDTVIPQLAQLEALKVLSLDGNPNLLGREFSAAVREGHFAELTRLSVSGTQFGFYGLQEVPRLKNLVELHVANSAVGDEILASISRCGTLEVLDLAGNRITTRGVRNLTKLRELRELNLGNCLGIDDGALSTLSKLKKLETLDLTGTRCSLNAVQELKEKSLRDTSIRVAQQEL